jgi:hypothetical protein
VTNAADARGAGGWLAPPRHRCETAAERPVADAMVTCPKTHGPRSGLEKIRAFFEDDHVHVALIVAADGRLVTTIERSDLAAATSGSASVAKLGTLIGRTAGPADPLGAVTATLLREGRRRLAVVDGSGRLLGLLCLKRDGTGYCSDEGIRERAQRTAQPRNQRSHALPAGHAEEPGAANRPQLSSGDHPAPRRAGNPPGR